MNIQDESYLSEASLRQALDRMGVGKRKVAVGAGAEGARDHQPTGRFAPKARSTPQQPAQRRRRFAGDDSVVVEHQSLGRSMQKRATNRSAMASDAEEEVERLQQSLQRERRRLRDVEAELSTVGNRVRTAETQVVHLRLQIDEDRTTLQARDEEVLRLKAELHQLREQAARKKPTPPKAKQARATAKPVKAEEPVQWWAD